MKHILLLFCWLILTAQSYPLKEYAVPTITGDSIEEDSEAAGQYHFHFKDCDKTVFTNTADANFPDDFRVDKPGGSGHMEGEIFCSGTLAAGTYKLHLLYASPAGPRAIWLRVGGSMQRLMSNANASILAASATQQWAPVVYTGSAANFEAGVNGGAEVSFVHAGGQFVLAFKAEDDLRFACGYLTTSATPARTCPGETPEEGPTADYVILELGAEAVPTAWNSAAFTHANTMQFTGTVSGTPATCTIKMLWDNAATDRGYISANCADTEAVNVLTSNDASNAGSSNEDKVYFAWRGDLSAAFDTDTYRVIGNLFPAYWDGDYSGASGTVNSAVSLNTTVQKNVVASTSWNIFLAFDLGSNFATDTIGLCNFAIEDRDAAGGNFRYFHGNSVVSMGQFGTCKWSATAVAASGGGGDVTAPVVTNPAVPVATVTTNSVIMTADTDEAGTCRVHYGTTTGVYTASSTGSASVNGVCTESVTGLLDNTAYFFEMRVTDGSSNVGDSTEVSRTTVDAPNCTHYASPSGSGNGLAIGTPFKISSFWALAAPGSELCLLDGTYTDSNSMITPTAGLSGNALNPIKVTAINDGAVWINGGGTLQPVRLNNNDWFVLSGFDASDSNGATVLIQNGASNNIIRRVCAWDGGGTNQRVWGITTSTSANNVIEDACGFGLTRRIFAISQGGPGTILRRTWAAYTQTTTGGPEAAYQFAYQGDNHTLENVIGTWKQAVDADAVNPFGVVHIANEGTGHKLLGSLFYVRSGDLFEPSRLVGTDWASVAHGPFEIRDTILYTEQATKRPWNLTNGSGVCTSCTITNTTEIGGTTSSIGGVWTQTNRADYDTIAAMNTASANPFQTSTGTGARMCFRYGDPAAPFTAGTLTSTKLWPWPMASRINAALVRAGLNPDNYFGTGNDLTEYIESVFGTIPAGCKS